MLPITLCCNISWSCITVTGRKGLPTSLVVWVRELSGILTVLDETLLLEQLVPWQEGLQLWKEHIPFLPWSARLNKSRAPLISAAAFQPGLERCPRHMVFPTKKSAKITQKFLKSWHERGHTVSSLLLFSSFPCYFWSKLPLAFWRIYHRCVLNL